MSALGRAKVALACPAADLSMLTEWLRAAGFEPCPPGSGESATLARWPLAADARTLQAPLVVCHAAAELPHGPGLATAEFLVWPDPNNVRSLLAWSTQCAAALRRLCGRGQPAPASATVAAAAPRASAERDERPTPELIALGISTGGPIALREFFTTLRGQDLPPMVIVQHIPPAFVQDLVDRLSRETGYRIEIAKDGVALQRRVAYIAPGDHHVKVITGKPMRVVWNDDPPRRGHRPAADVLFESCALLPCRGVGVIMTGMGQDGASGLLALRQLGWSTVGQDEATCAIYGMPRAAKLAGAVEREYPLAQLGPAIVAACEGRMLAVARARA
jgi:chemotaxis response regulator CheB